MVVPEFIRNSTPQWLRRLRCFSLDLRVMRSSHLVTLCLKALEIFTVSHYLKGYWPGSACIIINLLWSADSSVEIVMQVPPIRVQTSASPVPESQILHCEDRRNGGLPDTEPLRGLEQRMAAQSYSAWPRKVQSKTALVKALNHWKVQDGAGQHRVSIKESFQSLLSSL